MTRAISNPVELLPANTAADLVAIAKGWLSPDSDSTQAIGEFELGFSRLIGAGSAYSFAAGRVALAAILDALDIGVDNEIVVPGYTCVAVPNPVLYTGATPIYADIDRETLNISAATVAACLTSRTKAIIVQHTFGFPAPMDELTELSRRHGIPLIEDCTHALGATIGGRPVGSFGIAAFFSLEQTKVVSSGAGGIAYSEDSTLSNRLAQYQSRCEFPKAAYVRLMMGYLAYTVLLRDPRWSRHFPAAGYYLQRLRLIGGPISTQEEMRCEKPENFELRLSGAQARVATSQVKQLPENLAQRRKIAEIYRNAFRNTRVKSIVSPEINSPTYVRFPARVKNKIALALELKAQSIQLGLWFTAPIHPEGVPQSRARYTEGSCPEAETAVTEIVNFPCHPRMTEADAERVIQAVLKSPHA